MRAQISKEKFKAQYIERSKLTKSEFDKNYVVTPCDCEYENCRGWRVGVVVADEHIGFYSSVNHDRLPLNE